MNTKQKQAKASPRRSSVIQESSKAKRGRPKLAEGIKGTYKHLQLSPQKIERSKVFAQRPIVQQDKLIETMNEILAEKETALYYWQLVYSMAFEELQKKGNRKTCTLKQIAKEAGVKYHNMKKVYAGKGSTVIIQRYLLFLHMNGIDIQEIRIRKEVISDAYRHYINYIHDNPKKVTL